MIVFGEGPKPCPYMLVGEAPGADEETYGRPFVGRSGKELDNYLRMAGLRRADFYITNVVKMRPPGNRPPTAKEVNLWTPYLLEEIAEVQPTVIGAVGHTSTAWFLGPGHDMETVHGVPHYWKRPDGKQIVVVPIYHPAYGLRKTRLMADIARDFQALASVIAGRLRPIPTCADDGTYYYGSQHLPTPLPPVIALDTETLPDGNPYLVSIAWRVGEAVVIPPEELPPLDDVLVVMHNAQFDLRVLRRIGREPKTFADTMVMAYLLGEPQGLKALAKRLAFMDMTSYEEMIADASRDAALQYLRRILDHQWPEPEPIPVTTSKGVRLKRPWSIERRVQRILKDVASKPDTDPRSRWHSVSLEEGRALVEQRLGPMPEASLADIPLDRAIAYSGRDADATWRVYSILWPRIQAEGLEDTFWRDMRIIPMIVDMEENGILIDKKHFEELALDLKLEQAREEARIKKLVGKSLNPASPPQVATALFVEGGLRSLDSSTQAKYLQDVAANPDVPERARKLASHVLRWRECQKLLSTYVETLPTMTDEWGRIHTHFRITRTETGRLASANPNLQNIPTRTEDGKKIRAGFVASPGHLLLSADYSQIEMRVAAHVSGDPTMLAVFREGRDIHAETASRMFGVPLDQVDDKKHRYPAKRVGFGILYGISAKGLYDVFVSEGVHDWSIGDCQDLIDAWFDVYKGVRDWWERVRSEVLSTGRVRDMFGRYRLIPEVNSVHPEIREAGFRQAINTPIQSGAQGIIKEAMGRLVPIYRKFGVKPLLQIHDELIFEVPEDRVEEFRTEVISIMSTAVSLSVPLEVDTAVGHNWAEL